MSSSIDSVVVVTGASRGVGRATALSLARDHGCHVLAIARDTGALQELADEHASIRPLALDLRDEGTASKVKEVVSGRRVIGLVHNAGMLHRRPMGAHSRLELTELFALNVVAPLELTQALVDELDGDPPGHVVHIGSMGGFQDSAKFPGLVAYSSSKAAMACMAQCLAEEFKERGIRSNCLALGAVDTAMLREAFPGYTAPVDAARMGAYVARFLLEGHALYNGKVLPVALGTP